MPDIDAVRGWIDSAERVVVLTGAGISTDSGIPDFRGPNGVWTRNPAAEKASSIEYYLSDPEVRRAAWQTRLHSAAWDARPNAGHLALLELERSGRLHALVTQNVDGLHQIAGHDPARVHEVHGTMRFSRTPARCFRTCASAWRSENSGRSEASAFTAASIQRSSSERPTIAAAADLASIGRSPAEK